MSDRRGCKVEQNPVVIEGRLEMGVHDGQHNSPPRQTHTALRSITSLHPLQPYFSPTSRTRDRAYVQRFDREEAQNAR